MKEEFEYGELVEVRDNDMEEWVVRVYVGTMPNCKFHWSMKNAQDTTNFDGYVQSWRQIRKIQKPEPDLIEIEQPETIEQRMDKFEAILNGAIKHINEQIQSIKERIK